MGACFNSMVVEGNATKDQVSGAFDARCHQDGYDRGHSYSGSFSEFKGLVFQDTIFATYDEAKEYLLEYGQKWGPAIAVRYRHIEPSAMILKHDRARSKLQQKIWIAEAFVGGAKQKARINNRSSVPSYVTKAEKKLARIQKSVQPKIDARTAKIAAVYAKLSAKSKDVQWLIGGWCSS